MRLGRGLRGLTAHRRHHRRQRDEQLPFVPPACFRMVPLRCLFHGTSPPGGKRRKTGNTDSCLNYFPCEQAIRNSALSVWARVIGAPRPSREEDEVWVSAYLSKSSQEIFLHLFEVFATCGGRTLTPVAWENPSACSHLRLPGRIFIRVGLEARNTAEGSGAHGDDDT